MTSCNLMILVNEKSAFTKLLTHVAYWHQVKLIFPFNMTCHSYYSDNRNYIIHLRLALFETVVRNDNVDTNN